ncbi:cytochrome c oxidase subunit 3 [Mycolicibacterium mucogenicum]|uniref:cytochrome c oxidase subunit 3 n=1 Tax=Mycolicibacterium mucogenicum TaxID=56689 RepID=UPI00226AA1C1|nr:cytochrome c oxidase subunit 3 [Mycolicibacterium mucogenicum]
MTSIDKNLFHVKFLSMVAIGKADRQTRRLPGEEGTWVFIFGDMTVFAVLFGVYLYYRSADPVLFNGSQARLNQTFGVANTLVLLTSSLLVATAVRAVRQRENALAGRLIVGAMVCGGLFVVNKGIEYGHKISQGYLPATDQFFTYFYVVTGLHLVHVVVGMGLLWFMLTLIRRPELTAWQHSYLDGAACFWHMVDLLWIIIFPLLYLVK